MHLKHVHKYIPYIYQGVVDMGGGCRETCEGGGEGEGRLGTQEAWSGCEGVRGEIVQDHHYCTCTYDMYM